MNATPIDEEDTRELARMLSLEQVKAQATACQIRRNECVLGGKHYCPSYVHCYITPRQFPVCPITVLKYMREQTAEVTDDVFAGLALLFDLVEEDDMKCYLTDEEKKAYNSVEQWFTKIKEIRKP